jgi:hypothetical protein
MMLPKKPRCIICGSARKVEANHVGGRHHLAAFTMPFCYECHSRFHVQLRQAGVCLEFTEDGVERTRRALAAISVAVWVLLEKQREEINKRVTK